MILNVAAVGSGAGFDGTALSLTWFDDMFTAIDGRRATSVHALNSAQLMTTTARGAARRPWT